MAQQYAVYMVRCADGTFYTGLATDVARRVGEHNGAGQGARYTRARRPVRLAYVESCRDRSQASQREYALRHLPRALKEILAAEWEIKEEPARHREGTWKTTGS